MVNQHLGAPSQILVKKGDMVKVGQLLTSNEAFLGSVVHSPVSGIVNKIGEAIDTSLYPKAAIYIDVEGDQWEDFIDQSPEIKREIVLSKAEIIQRIKEMGIVGLGGACFPTHVKINIPKTCKAEYLLINGVECEPFLTDDYRLILEKGEEILIGISILMKALEVKQALIGIENNKPKAIAYLSELAKSFPGISVHPLKMKYPQGAEKQLIKALVNKEVPSGKLPISVGCVVNNVGTCQAVYQAVQKHKPLVERMVTVTGVQVAEPRNFWVRIGTPISELIEACGGLPKDTAKIISGGPMMGKALSDINTPVTKGVSAVLLVPEAEAHRREVH
ncbi:MAG: RnfABCDGE type electron transport complex subunit C, partial [Bacteroidales bacterium]